MRYDGQIEMPTTGSRQSYSFKKGIRNANRPECRWGMNGLCSYSKYRENAKHNNNILTTFNPRPRRIFHRDQSRWEFAVRLAGHRLGGLAPGSGKSEEDHGSACACISSSPLIFSNPCRTKTTDYSHAGGGLPSRSDVKSSFMIP
jgi:hypothetical protein